MAQLKSGSTENSIEILKKDLTNVSSSLTASVKSTLKGDTGTTGTTGTAGASRSYSYDGTNTIKLTDTTNISYSLVGTTLNITT